MCPGVGVAMCEFMGKTTHDCLRCQGGCRFMEPVYPQVNNFVFTTCGLTVRFFITFRALPSMSTIFEYLLCAFKTRGARKAFRFVFTPLPGFGHNLIVGQPKLLGH